ncbi:hypothetical protein DF3PA_200048 [Candidatus Defluviicoccus seviourii]|uniref:Uncharacterized protein n=1 Tax=Candidatus Defluviicoccus seviourii TaxID=2565273 RepID=A0A564WD16_9PROT|nr:hypothetical protein DF3PA_200048 [Candidatus Defluviicoccus seviourii]
MVRRLRKIHHRPNAMTLGAANAGLDIEPEKVDDTAAAICRLADDHGLYQRMNAGSPVYMRGRLDGRKLTAHLFELIENLVAKRRSWPSALAKTDCRP